MIQTVYRWNNDMVMVFDEEGQQIPKYQGQYSEVREAIIDDAPESAVFYHAVWKKSSTLVPKEKW